MSTGGKAPAGRASRLVPRSPGQELTALLLLGALGAGLILLATKQDWAQVRTSLPRPLPDSHVAVTGAGLVPYADALVIAGLATLAAILASKRLLRRLTGVLLAAIGAGLAVSAFTLSRAGAISAASSSVSPETAAAGSVMDGSGTATTTPPDVAGTATHVVFSAAGWQALVVAGAAAMMTAGIAVAWRANRLAVMSSRYDAPTAAAGQPPRAPSPKPAAPPPRPQTRTRVPPPAAGPPADSASIWEALSRGDDPTSAGSRTASGA